MTNEQLAFLLTEIYQRLSKILDEIDNHLAENGANRHTKRGKWIGDPKDDPSKGVVAYFCGFDPNKWEWIDDPDGNFVCLDSFREYLKELQFNILDLTKYNK